MTRNARLSIGPAVPGLVFGAIGVLAALCAALLLGASPFWLVATPALAALGAALPRTGGAWLASGALVLLLIIREPDAARAATAVFTVHLLHVLGTLSLAAGPLDRIALAALRPTTVRFAVVQSISQAALAVALLASGAAPTVSLAAMAGAAATLALAVLLRGMLARHRTDAFAMSESGPR